MFTKLEIEIIEHRLDVPYAIAEALEPEGDIPSATFLACIEKRIAGVRAAIATGRIDQLGPLAFAVLEEAIDGSTYVASMVGDPTVSRQRMTAATAALESATQKIATARETAQ